MIFISYQKKQKNRGFPTLEAAVYNGQKVGGLAQVTIKPTVSNLTPLGSRITPPPRLGRGDFSMTRPPPITSERQVVCSCSLHREGVYQKYARHKRICSNYVSGIAVKFILCCMHYWCLTKMSKYKICFNPDFRVEAGATYLSRNKIQHRCINAVTRFSIRPIIKYMS